MQAGGELVLEAGVDRSVAVESRQTAEDFRDDGHPVVRFAFRAGASVADVPVRFVNYIDGFRRKGFSQAGVNGVSSGHNRVFSRLAPTVKPA